MRTRAGRFKCNMCCTRTLKEQILQMRPMAIKLYCSDKFPCQGIVMPQIYC
ncbi:hypothetical protein CK203_074448 [Vitis vinifera]|uniref:Uncharacterized protein n=1 Tax=Vitis vinifera TaxID=29760 RepID=A0A438EH18_VITVI|nr:hypothetical protein CK203_074448 [Vitis vinifera]